MALKSRRLRLSIAYDGTGLAGWQRQKNAPSIQEILEKAFHQILQQPVKLTGAGRTDAGVHALGQVVHGDIQSGMALPKLQKALNAVLPEQIVIRSIAEASRKFHARYSAKMKTYQYLIWNDPLRPVFERQKMHHVPEPLDLAAMRRTAKRLTGKRDFKAFRSSGSKMGSSVRHLRALKITKQGPLLTVEATADGFLYHMVRRIVGQLIEAGKGNSPAVAPTAPAKGLCLMSVKYDSSG